MVAADVSSQLWRPHRLKNPCKWKSIKSCVDTVLFSFLRPRFLIPRFYDMILARVCIDLSFGSCLSRKWIAQILFEQLLNFFRKLDHRLLVALPRELVGRRQEQQEHERRRLLRHVRTARARRKSVGGRTRYRFFVKFRVLPGLFFLYFSYFQ